MPSQNRQAGRLLGNEAVKFKQLKVLPVSLTLWSVFHIAHIELWSVFHIAHIELWSVFQIAHIAPWSVFHIAHIELWSVFQIAHTALWSVFQIAHTALWSVFQIAHIALWSVFHIAHIALWSVFQIAHNAQRLCAQIGPGLEAAVRDTEQAAGAMGEIDTMKTGVAKATKKVGAGERWDVGRCVFLCMCIHTTHLYIHVNVGGRAFRWLDVSHHAVE